jgi:YesN/AraC family two-component response regulator
VNLPDQLSLDNLARELLIIMGESEQTKVDEKIAQILNYVHAHYAEDVSLSALAKRFSLSESYIARLFREKVGTKPASYVNRVRISAAKELILGTDCPMSEIAEKIGFSDTYYFSNTFKKFEGTSPSQFRKRYTN